MPMMLATITGGIPYRLHVRTYPILYPSNRFYSAGFRSPEVRVIVYDMCPDPMGQESTVAKRDYFFLRHLSQCRIPPR